MTYDGDGAHGQPVTRRQMLKGLGASGAAVTTAGCNTSGSEENETPTSSSGVEELLEEDEDLRNIQEDLEDDDFEDFVDHTTNNDGEYTKQGKKTVEYVSDIRDEVGDEPAQATAESIAEEDNLTGEHNQLIDFWLSTEDDQFRKTVFNQGVSDTNSDGLYDGEAEYFKDKFETDAEEVNSEEVAQDEGFVKLVESLRAISEDADKEGFTLNDLEYLETVVPYFEHKDNPFLEYAQAEALGLLGNAVESQGSAPSINDETLYQVQRTPEEDVPVTEESLLIRGIKQKHSAMDPDKMCSGEDGIKDGYKLYMEDFLGYPVTLGEPDVLVEWATTENINTGLREDTKDIIKEAHPANIHFYELDVSIPGFDETRDGSSQMRGKRDDFTERGNKGYRTLFLAGDNISDEDGKDVSGLGSGQVIVCQVLEQEEDGEDRLDSGYTASIVGHELGHSSGRSGHAGATKIMTYDHWEATEYDDGSIRMMRGADFLGDEQNYEGIRQEIYDGDKLEDWSWETF